MRKAHSLLEQGRINEQEYAELVHADQVFYPPWIGTPPIPKQFPPPKKPKLILRPRPRCPFRRTHRKEREAGAAHCIGIGIAGWQHCVLDL